MSKKVIENELGNITIEQEVIAEHAGMAALDCFGIVGMAIMNVTDGIVYLLKRESANKDVRVVMKDDMLYIEMHIIVAYGVNITTVTENLINAVTYNIEHNLGIKVNKIVVCVDNVRVID
jgi:uncharacterized alkaline shock family protein YloU